MNNGRMNYIKYALVKFLLEHLHYMDKMRKMTRVVELIRLDRWEIREHAHTAPKEDTGLI